jgi:hypothetical protein
VQVATTPHPKVVINPPNPTSSKDGCGSGRLGVLIKSLTHKNNKVARSAADDAIEGKKVSKVHNSHAFTSLGE